MKLDYDEAKNARNIAERQLSFERVRELDFDHVVIKQDTRQDYPEPRYVALAMLEARLHVLCFTPTVEGIRVISFRKANSREVKRYEKAHATDG